jgi:hypothetical protein
MRFPLPLLFLLLILPATARAEASFFSGLPDVPVMPGMTELPADSVVFDKAEGRIVQAAASGQGIDEASVRGFYDETLPQFGWSKSGDGTYSRDDEMLEVAVDNENGREVVQITVSPR